MFVLLTLSIVILIGTFMVNSTDRYYHNEFQNLMNTVFQEEYVRELEANLKNENPIGAIYSNLYNYTGQLGIDSFRNLYLLDGKTGKAVDSYSTNEALSKELDVSTNIITAMSGEYGTELNTSLPYMDYAVPLKDADGVRYIAYIRDTKEETDNVVQRIFIIMLEAMVLALIISLLFPLTHLHISQSE